MVLHPDVQQKAFEEIRSVCGSERLPSYHEDRENLPYFSATVMENFRWTPVLSLGIHICSSGWPNLLTALLIGVPHKNVSDDICGDYYIPRGSTVFPNIW
jgi:hypothetical protein